MMRRGRIAAIVLQVIAIANTVWLGLTRQVPVIVAAMIVIVLLLPYILWFRQR